MRLMNFARSGVFATAWLLSLANSAALAEEYSPGVGLADPAVSINASGYAKWGQSSMAPFIDRMKGAFIWSGRLPSDTRESETVHVLSDPAVFGGKVPPLEIVLRPSTVIDLNRLLVAAAFQKKVISREQNQKINRSPELFFKLERGPNGASRVMGRLLESEPFVPLVQFDRDAGMDLAELRRLGHLYLINRDLSVPAASLDLDQNGWPMHLPADRAGRKGEISTTVMWYPGGTAEAPDSLYAGNFYLLADGEGTLSLTQKGSGPDVVKLKGVKIDGPSAVPFRYQPNGQPVSLTLEDTDPGNTGEYLRSIRIVHERHLPLFQAGEVFTPEYGEFMQDFRAIRWMGAMEGPRNPSFFEGAFDDRTKLDFYTFNLGTNKTDRNGFPIDAIIAFANKTGTDPWITVPVNVSDEFARGMAAFIAAKLDPDLKLYVELGNENWNGIFPSYQHSASSGIERWGELTLKRGADGKPQIVRPGRFVSSETLGKSGFATLPELTKALGSKHPLVSKNQAWAEWSGMRATQVGRIFEEAFAEADPATAKRRLNNVMGTFATWAGSTDLLMQTAVWREEEPDTWIDPKEVFESLAVGAYFGGTLGSQNSDLVTHWIETMGQAEAKKMVLRHLEAGLDPAKPYLRIGPAVVRARGEDGNAVDQVPRDVVYSRDLVIDVSDLLQGLHPGIEDRIRSGAGVKQKQAVLTADEALHYLRLGEEAGNTTLEVRTASGEDSFQTVLVFDGKVSQSLPQMLADGVILPRSLYSMQQEAVRYFGNQADKAQAYGLKLVAYEGGQHLAAAIWGLYRANLQNQPLVDLLRDLNQSPEIEALYGFWFDKWRQEGGEAFAHYADIGFPSRYGNWGVISYLGQDKVPGYQSYKLGELRKQNAAGAWWKEDRAATAFLQGLQKTGSGGLTGTAKGDVLVGVGSKNRLDGGPGNDALIAGAGINMVDAGAGDDIIVVSSVADSVDGGSGFDVVKPALGMADMDLSALKAMNIEAVDTRNAARTKVTVKPGDILRLTGGRQLAIFAESKDQISINGFARTGAEQGPAGFTAHYQADDGGGTVSLSVTTDIAAR